MVAVRGVEVTGSRHGYESRTLVNSRFGKVGWGTQGVLVGHKASWIGGHNGTKR